MTKNTNKSDNTGSNRRTFLAATAVGSALLAGCLSSDDEGEADNGDDDSEPTAELHERYGYPTTEGEEPPVEPDHEVDLLMDQPEQGPPEFYFEPAGLAVESGDVVQFNFNSPDHAVTTFHEAFGRSHRAPEDAEALSSPMMAVGTSWLAEFEAAGVWDLYCPPHESMGMGMRIVVDEATGPATEPAGEMVYEPGESLPPEDQLAATYDNDALEPETILEDGSVTWDDLK
ncbi:cupredoxin domain-containing protein [Natronorubrum sulfidifaciens]|uniref:Blue (type 1) copper domain-containing protein n=1 Tax=Natronorubrum sulfidifaciens JCM 14089 TaxID=1230460 RepID=L9W9H2_9EURY|nr:plastocyanin/azurin family copper-binding protein [Natronorubrum sulfidifaciens]ELY44973.1 hypothetical protein C495_08520 [Natronorubrum sulfidifaciens JCM 14089]